MRAARVIKSAFYRQIRYLKVRCVTSKLNPCRIRGRRGEERQGEAAVQIERDGGAVCNPRSCKTRARPAVERKNAGVILARAKCRWMRKLFESSKQRDNRELFAIDGANFGGDMSKRSLSSDARKQRAKIARVCWRSSTFNPRYYR